MKQSTYQNSYASYKNQDAVKYGVEEMPVLKKEGGTRILFLLVLIKTGADLIIIVVESIQILILP